MLNSALKTFDIAHAGKLWYNTPEMQKPGYIAHKVVLLFIKPRFVSQRERISGIYSAAIKRGWQIQPINKTPDAETVQECEMLWHPSGCLVDQSALSGRLDKKGHSGNCR